MASAKARSLPHLDSGEVSLLDLAEDDLRDAVSFSDKEALILRLYNQLQEQELEKALLEQGELPCVSEDAELLSGDDAEEQLATAERELLEARATYTVRRKALETVLMTDPTLKAVHMKATYPAEQTLLRLINRRDVLSLAHENLNTALSSTLKKLSNAEVENLQLHQKNKALVRELLDLTKNDESWREELDDMSIMKQLEQVKADHQKSKAKWETMKSIISAIVVGSGVNWAENEELVALVLDDSDD
ncbi:centromere protein H (CENP-H)-domain-containing protein [Aspergillus caelatus]|uniref:Centromere protein H (CENP-H)-domain-containing protein n=1 Tax=Aspergillus caelatus TaxID=61420 RepID=A0A5N7AAA8_9EURO|nr:centromere protein H (CENP-H)-domain-containing protein [Aspergillus caelatus]KAE8366817.1 centromere protein H (CENP-H)-domain-containing protein [Aspergillus caelatus]